MASKSAAIACSLLGLGAVTFTAAIALPFDDRIEFRSGNRIDSQPAWLVPQNSEFLGMQRGYGGLKILAALTGTVAMGGAMIVSRKQLAQEPLRQKLRQHRQQVTEQLSAAESAYQVALWKQRYEAQLEADQVWFREDLKREYLGTLGSIPTYPALPGTSLDQVVDPRDKVGGEDAPAIADTASPTPSTSAGLPSLTNYPSVLVYGSQGSGKTTFAEQEIQRRLRAGHRVIVLDPHARFGGWRGCEVIGAGMDYASIDAKLGWFAGEVKRRYELIAKQPDPKFQPLTVVVDEFTNWASRCDNAGEFFKAALSDIRKAECYVLIISHTRTLPGLGDAKGMASLRDAALLEIELLGQIDPATGRAVPKFEALIKLPGQGQGDRQLIKIPRTTPQQQVQIDTEYLEKTYHLEFEINPPPVSPESDDPDNEGYDANQGKEGDSADADTLDTYPETDWLPSQNQLLAMLGDTKLPAGRFIKEVLKATKPDKYRLAKQAIRWVVRHRGDFTLMEKFKDLLQ